MSIEYSSLSRRIKESKQKSIEQSEIIASFKQKMNFYSAEDFAVKPQTFDSRIFSLNYRYDPEFKVLEKIPELNCISLKHIKSFRFVEYHCSHVNRLSISLIIEYKTYSHDHIIARKVAGLELYEKLKFGTFSNQEIKCFVMNKVEEYFMNQGINILGNDRKVKNNKTTKILFKQEN